MATIKELIELQKSNELAKKRLEFILNELENKNGQLSALEDTMLNEHADVTELESRSLKSVFRKFLGDKEKQLEKERQEYLHAFMKYEAFKKSLDILQYEKGILQEKVANAADVSAQITKLLAIRKKEIMLNGSAAGEKISQLESEINTHYYIRKECIEAVEVGNSAVGMMAEMIQNLKAAHNWGTWNVGAKGRAINTAIKMASIDKAKKISHQAQHLLRVFSKELADIHGQQKFDLSFNIDGFNSFLDVFFDNLISDWVIQRKIAAALSSVSSTEAKVKRIVYSLEVDIKKSEAEILKKEEAVKLIIQDSVQR